VDHPSCSKTHAVVQFKLGSSKQQLEVAAEAQMSDDDPVAARIPVWPYVVDLKSTNGTFLNGDRLESERYVQLKHGDIIKFGTSTREYVIIDSTRGESEKLAAV